MRRQILGAACLVKAAAAPVLTESARGIYTTWASIPLEPWATKEPWLKRLTNQSRYRSFEFWHVPEAKAPTGIKFSSVELYLLSGIEDDTNRLLNLSWTYDFDSFWRDRVDAHEMLYNSIYKKPSFISGFLFGNYSDNEAGRKHIEKKLNYLKSVLLWAFATEHCHSAIVKARFVMQRDVWNALERERYLAGCLEVVETFKKEIPQEFAKKAIEELQNDLTAMRHWVWDCPNVKRAFPQLS
ncbi:hypothetical protein, conserved [Trypanosoma brucei brucei TREU927]|uniref:Succinate dehydrogenase subunit n=1 Tax=Trypanosoma brucei brucei (strain 927/4 GUTat10.1) TaxID=185431 RepID=Q584Q7_TRYB2|nr:hypothetical protein, conserved [Trypanosoma brucei brucei TREU927]AAX80881.1 hypothetical protein, conserved [Trypanosoma brucei]AAZ11811.1 hypothetical protein, conserved [Trypanosoma brucei brucei TREU927]